MKYTEAKKGRVYIIRLEDGEVIHESLEAFAKQEQLKSATITVTGAIDKGSLLVTGPKEDRAAVIEPVIIELTDVYEIIGTGTLFPDDTGEPKIHIHISCGRKGETLVGCIQKGVKVWHVVEVILQELTDNNAKRLPDKATGYKLLEPS